MVGRRWSEWGEVVWMRLVRRIWRGRTAEEALLVLLCARPTLGGGQRERVWGGPTICVRWASGGLRVVRLLLSMVRWWGVGRVLLGVWRGERGRLTGRVGVWLYVGRL